LNIQDWQSKNDEARATDQRLLMERFGDLERNQNNLMNTLSMYAPMMSFPCDERFFLTDVQQNNVMAIQALLQKQLTDRSVPSREQQFYQQSLRHISNLSGIQVELNAWTITAFEVDMGPEIGSGGLYVIHSILFVRTSRFGCSCIMDSGRVHKGTRNKTPVALKVLKTEHGITPNSKVTASFHYLGFDLIGIHAGDPARD
jgi:hypothetical protein